MADVRYAVTVDSSGAVKQIEALDKAWEKLGKETAPQMKTSGDWLGQSITKLAAGFTLANMATKAFTAIGHEVKKFFMDSIDGAIKEEQSLFRLKTALEMTGRAADGVALEAFAQEMHKTTLYTDDQVRATMTMLAQMTNLDAAGIKAVTKGVIGLASVLGPGEGLEGATMRVTRAIEGNAAGLKRVGINIDDTLPKGEQLAQVQEKLLQLFPRATAELDTTGGSIQYAAKQYGELKEKIGGIINETFNFKGMAVQLSGALTENADRTKETARSFRELAIEHSGFMSKGGFGVMYRDAAIATNMLEDNKQAIDEWLASLQEVHPPLKEVHAALLSGSKQWEEYKKRIEETDKTMVAFKPTVEKAMDAVVKFLQAGKEKPDVQPVLDLAQAFKDLGVKSEKELAAKLKLAKDALAEYLKTQGPAAGVVASLQGKVNELTLALNGPPDPLLRLGKTIHSITTETKSAVEAFEDFKREALEAVTVELPEVDLDEIFKVPDSPALPAFLLEIVGDYNKVGQAAEINAGKVAASWDEMTKTALESKLVALRTRLDDMTRSGNYTAAAMGRVRKAIKDTEQELKDTPKAVQDIQKAFTDMAPYVEAVFSGLNRVFAQSQQNREIAIENEYKKRLRLINATVKDEDAKQKAIQTLEAEFEIKRTEARAASAKQAKAVAIAEAIWNTARAVSEALPNIVLAAVVAALGALSIAAIISQPIPLARGAVFRRPTLLTDDSGKSYEVGEGGEPEYLIPEKHLAPLLGRQSSPAGFISTGGRQTSKVIINVNAPLVSTSGLTQADIERAGAELFRTIERRSRQRGRW